MDQHVVDREHDGRVDRVRFGDRDLVRRGLHRWRELLGHGLAMPPGPEKKGRRRGRPLRWEVLLGKFESLERRLDGSHHARVAVISPATLAKHSSSLKSYPNSGCPPTSGPGSRASGRRSSRCNRGEFRSYDPGSRTPLMVGEKKLNSLPGEGVADRSLDRIRFAKIWKLSGDQ